MTFVHILCAIHTYKQFLQFSSIFLQYAVGKYTQHHGITIRGKPFSKVCKEIGEHWFPILKIGTRKTEYCIQPAILWHIIFKVASARKP